MGEQREQAAHERADKAEEKWIAQERARLSHGNRDEKRGVDSEDRSLRGDRSATPAGVIWSKSRERLLAPPDPQSGLKPTEADRDTMTDPKSRFTRSGDSQFVGSP